jgi:hypothetical protein
MKNNILTNKILIMKKMNFIQKMFFMLACMMSLHAMTLNAQGTTVSATAGKDFYVTYMSNYGTYGTSANVSLQLKVIVTKPTVITAEYNAMTGNYWKNWNNTLVDAGVYTAEVVYDRVLNEATGTSFRTLNITSSEDICVYAINFRNISTDAAVILPVPVWGMEYYLATGGQPQGITNCSAEYAVIARENGTVVTIHDGTTQTLQKGEVYHHVMPEYSTVNLDGAKVSANKPVAVFSGNMMTSPPFSNGGASDHTYEQMWSTEKWGTDFFAWSPRFYQSGGSTYFNPSAIVCFIAKENDTHVTVTGGNQLPGGVQNYTLSAGQSQRNNYTMLAGLTRIVSDKPILVYSLITDPSVTYIAATDQRVNRVVMSPFISPGISNIDVHSLEFIVPSAYWDKTVIKENGIEHSHSEYTVTPSAAFPEWSLITKYFSNKTEVMIDVECPGGLLAYMFGNGTAETYGYIAGAAARNLQDYFTIQDNAQTNYAYYTTTTPVSHAFKISEIISVKRMLYSSFTSVKWLINGTEYTGVTENGSSVNTLSIPASTLQEGENNLSMAVRYSNATVDSIYTGKVWGLTDVNYASAGDNEVAPGSNIVFTVKLPNNVIAQEDITVNLSLSGNTSNFVNMSPTAVIIPTGANSADFTVTALASAINNAAMTITITGTDKNFIIAGTDNKVRVIVKSAGSHDINIKANNDYTTALTNQTVDINVLENDNVSYPNSSLGKDFWLSFGMSGNATSKSVALQVKIVAAQDATVKFTFTNINTTTTINAISAGTTYLLTLNEAQKQAVYPALYNETSNKSLHIESTGDIAVYAINNLSGATDATNILPITALGRDYYHLSYNEYSTSDNYMDGMLLVATDDNTTINVNGTNVNLSKGQVYYKTGVDMTGQHVTSNSPVAHFVVHHDAFVPSYTTLMNGSTLFQQMLPVETYGTKFLVPVSLQVETRIRIVASQSGTVVSQTGGSVVANSLNLNAGEYVELSVTSQKGCHITSNYPVAVSSYLQSYKGGNTSTTGAPAMTWIPPLQQSVDSITINTFAAITNSYAMIIVPTAKKTETKQAVGTAAFNNINGGTWYDNADSGYSYYMLPLTSNYIYKFTNPAGLIALVYGAVTNDSYYYLAGYAGAAALCSNTVTLTSQPNHGTAIVQPDGTVTYTPDKDWLGIDSVHYTVNNCNTEDSAFVYIITQDKPDNISKADCFTPPVKSAWDIERKAVSDVPIYFLATPLVGDVDGDRHIEVVTMGENVANYNICTENILIFDADLKLKYTISTPRLMSYSTSFLLADVDRDGVAEIIATMSDKHLICYSYATGQWQEKWRSDNAFNTTTSAIGFYPSLVIADVNHDGHPEVLATDKIFDAETGLEVATLPAGGRGYVPIGNSETYMPVFADIDGDGTLDVVAGNTVYRVNIADRTNPNNNSVNILTKMTNTTTFPDGFTSVADIDNDGDLDVIVTAGGSAANTAIMYVWDGATATQIGGTVSVSSNGKNISRATVGDINGDKQPDIAFAYTNGLRTMTYNAGAFTTIRDLITDDASGATSLIMFDFNQDGEVELIFRDALKLRIYNKSGNVLNSFDCLSDTHTEYPVIVDLDRDGHAEILVSGKSDGYNDVRLIS